MWGGAAHGKSQPVISSCSPQLKGRDAVGAVPPTHNHSSVSNPHSLDFWAGTALTVTLSEWLLQGWGMLHCCFPLGRLFHPLSYFLSKISFLEINNS